MWMWCREDGIGRRGTAGAGAGLSRAAFEGKMMVLRGGGSGRF